MGDIQRFKINKPVYWLLGLLGFTGLVIASYFIGARTNIMSDFTVFWQAGKNFSSGNSLYNQTGGACRYIYPPFAAMLFQVFGLFELKTAAGIYCLVNFLLWIGIFYYTWSILQLCKIERKYVNISLIAGIILSFRYFWYHMFFIQINQLVLCMSLVAVKALLEKRNTYAVFLLVIASFIKILPVFLLIWALSKSNWKAFLYAFAFTVICISLPVLFRGFHTGITDIKDYYQTFIGPFKNGRVEPQTQNYGLNAALYKMFSVTDEGTKYGYFITELPQTLLKNLSIIISAFLLVLYVSMLAYSRLKRKECSLLEISFILLFTHLVSGITWEYHFVSMGFVVSILTTQFLKASKKERYIFYPLILIVLVNDIIGMSTVGYTLFYKSCGYSLLTIMTLILALFQFFCYFDKRRNYPVFPATT